MDELDPSLLERIVKIARLEHNGLLNVNSASIIQNKAQIMVIRRDSVLERYLQVQQRQTLRASIADARTA